MKKLFTMTVIIFFIASQGWAQYTSNDQIISIDEDNVATIDINDTNFPFTGTPNAGIKRIRIVSSSIPGGTLSPNSGEHNFGGTITYTPTANANNTTMGAAPTFSFQVSRIWAGANWSPTYTYTISVNPVNDPPTITLASDQTIDEDVTAPQTVSGFATGMAPGGGSDESSQTLTINCSADNTSLFSVQPAINVATGDLTYTLAADKSGTTTVTVTITDSGGESTQETFTITVNPINDAPVLVNHSGITIDENAVNQPISRSVLLTTDVDNTPDQITYTISQPSHGVIRNNGVIQSTFTQEDIDNGLLTYSHDGTNVSGSTTDNFQVTAISDGNLSVSGLPVTITITINSVNDAPVLDNTETTSLTYITKGANLPVTGSTEANDEEEAITSATMRIASGYQNGADELSLSTPGLPVGTSAVWDATTATLSVTRTSGGSTFTSSEMTTIITHLQYSNSFTPPSNAMRTISITVTDDNSSSSASVSRDINVPYIINVPSDYPTITEAIDASIDDAIIKVAAGTYLENINFNGKKIQIIGDTIHPSNVIIKGTLGGGSVVTFSGGENAGTQLSGFRIINGEGTLVNPKGPYSPYAYYGGGIYCTDASPLLSHLIVENNNVKKHGYTGGSGGGIFLKNSSAILRDIIVRYNTVEVYRGGGMSIDDCKNLRIHNLNVNNNTSGYYGGGIAARNSSIKFTGSCRVQNNKVTGPNQQVGSGLFLIYIKETGTGVTTSGNTGAGQIYKFNTP